MEIRIIKGSIDYINDCEEALTNSKLGMRYFSREGITEHLMMKVREEKR